MKNSSIPQTIQSEIDKLLGLCTDFEHSESSVHTMEQSILKQLLILGLSLLKHILKQKLKQESSSKIFEVGEQKAKKKGFCKRYYLSLFGLLSFERQSYFAPSVGKIYPFDDELNFPKESAWSYVLQELVAENASENDYTESVRVLNKLLNLNLSSKSSQRNIINLGDTVEAFYAVQKPKMDLEGSCYAVSFDGKGVPKIKRKPASEAGCQPKKRLNKGEKPNLMQVATVVVVSSFLPKVRSVESLLNGLMDKPLSKKESNKNSADSKKENDNRWHKNIHRRAFLGNQEKAIFYGIKQIKERIEKNGGGRFVVPMDAGIGLDNKVLEAVKKYELEESFDGIILDIIHVTEYVWSAANAILGENSKQRYNWVRSILKDILEGNITRVIHDLRRITEKAQLSKSQIEQVEKTINYFSNHKSKMAYNIYIQKGYPISSALVESTCGHLVKERMEQTGMRWSTLGAQNLLDVRAVKQNGDMEKFMDFFIKKQHPCAYNIAS